jgi:2-dehydro-3-deoxyphosphogluconate aldolase/(4S)-4-hydroxy-2-oxoglutarate aldolase
MGTILDKIGELGVVPVIAIENAADAPQLGRALLAGGLPCAEITFRTAAAPEAIRLMTAECPDVMVGAGTVMTVAQAEQAAEAGVKFVVTPGFDGDVVDWCIANNMPITPGVLTPTEINMALKKGLNIVKFFPAEAGGGVKALKAIAAPYVGVKFIPTGGISAANLSDYLSQPFVHACGGSWMVAKKLISDGQFDKITEMAAEAVALAKQIRQGA